MIALSVNIEDGASPMLREFIGALTGPQMSELTERGGRGAVNAAVKYHREFDQAGGWRGKHYLGPSQNDGASFGADVARGWFFMEADAGGATIANHAEHYAFKVSGGTITPKRAGALTIPLIPEARGLYASVYQQNTGHRLFTIRGKHALFERTDQTVTGSRGRRGRPGASSIKKSGIRPVYALVASVTQGPWPGALPPDEILTDAFREQFSDGLEEIIERS
jgi:hypothetical protein